MAVKYKLKYYKFLIYFALWISAVATFVAGIMQMSGIVWDLQGVWSADIYAAMPAFRVVDIAYGAIQVIMAFMIIVVRNRLAGFRKGAPGAYIALLVVNMLHPAIYALAASLILEVGFVEIFDFATCLGSLVGIIVNAIYFGKRKKLFKK